MKKIILLGALLVAGLAQAQSNLGLYHFDGVPQTLLYNPGSPQQTRFFIGIPALSSLHLNISNSGFTPKDLFEKGVDINTAVQRTLNKLDGTSHLSTQVNLELFHLGFSIGGKHFISFGAYQSNNILLDYPVDLLRFLFPNGASPQDQMNIDLSSFNYEQLSVVVNHIGYQYTFLKDRLTVGGRFKYYIGGANTYLDRFNVSLNSTPDNLLLTTDIRFRSAGVSGFLDNNFQVGDVFKNNGIGFDIGAHYRISKRFSASFSVLDMGSITWNANQRDYVSQGTFEFNGVDYDLNDGDFESASQAIQDSLEKQLDFQEVDGTTYTRSLPTQFFVGGEWHLSPKSTIGLVYQGRSWNGNLKNNYSINYVGRFARWFQLMVNYNIINGTYSNIGTGISLKLAPLQIYVITDNAFAVNVGTAQNINLRFGINIALSKKNNRLKESFFAEPLPLPPGEVEVDESELISTPDSVGEEPVEKLLEATEPKEEGTAPAEEAAPQAEEISPEAMQKAMEELKEEQAAPEAPVEPTPAEPIQENPAAEEGGGGTPMNQP